VSRLPIQTERDTSGARNGVTGGRGEVTDGAKWVDVRLLLVESAALVSVVTVWSVSGQACSASERHSRSTTPMSQL